MRRLGDVLIGLRCYVLLRRRHDVPIRCHGDVPLRRLGDVPPRLRRVFHLRRTCDVVGTYREASLRRRRDVLLPGGITEGICFRSKCDWYEHTEKSTKFFLNLEKQRGAQNIIKKLIADDKEITDQTHILEYIREFYEALFKKRKQKTATEIKNF